MEHLRRSFDYTCHPYGTSQSAADRPCRLERLSEPELLLRAPGRDLPDHRPQRRPCCRIVFIAGMFVKYGEEYADICRPSAAEAKSRAAEAIDVMTGSPECRLGRRMVPPCLRCIQPQGGSKRNVKRADLHRATGLLRYGWNRVKEGLAEKASEIRGRAVSGYQVRCYMLQPGLHQYHLNLGEISSYPPGYKENAGIFCHNNPWIIHR